VGKKPEKYILISEKTSALYNGLVDFVDGLTVCSSCQQNANKCDISISVGR
jgi:hypothetical protein